MVKGKEIPRGTELSCGGKEGNTEEKMETIPGYLWYFIQ